MLQLEHPIEKPEAQKVEALSELHGARRATRREQGRTCLVVGSVPPSLASISVGVTVLFVAPSFTCNDLASVF